MSISLIKILSAIACADADLEGVEQALGTGTPDVIDLDNIALTRKELEEAVGLVKGAYRQRDELVAACDGLMQFEAELGGLFDNHPSLRSYFDTARTALTKAKEAP
jgi:hypothetical protein